MHKPAEYPVFPLRPGRKLGVTKKGHSREPHNIKFQNDQWIFRLMDQASRWRSKDPALARITHYTRKPFAALWRFVAKGPAIPRKSLADDFRRDAVSFIRDRSHLATLSKDKLQLD